MYAAPGVRAAYDKQEGTVALLDQLFGQWRPYTHEVGCLWEFLLAGDDLQTALRKVAEEYGISEALVRQDQASIIRSQRLRLMLIPWNLGTPKSLPEPSCLREGELGGEDDVDVPDEIARAAKLGLRIALVFEWLPFPVLVAILQFGRRLKTEAPSAELTRAIVAAVRSTHNLWPLRRACLEEAIAKFVTGFLLGKPPYCCLGAAFRPRGFHSWAEDASLTPIGERDDFPFEVALRI